MHLHRRWCSLNLQRTELMNRLLLIANNKYIALYLLDGLSLLSSTTVMSDRFGLKLFIEAPGTLFFIKHTEFLLSAISHTTRYYVNIMNKWTDLATRLTSLFFKYGLSAIY